MLVKNGAIIAISNKYGDTPLSKARPRLRKKLEALAGEYGQSLVIVPHKSKPLACWLRNLIDVIGTRAYFWEGQGPLSHPLPPSKKKKTTLGTIIVYVCVFFLQK